jgi:hypothetical protein
MPYSSLNTQIEAIKSEISSSLAASAYSAQDLVYVAKALQALGSLVEPDGVANLEITSKLFVGASAPAFETNAGLTNATIIATASPTTSDFAQIAFKNTNTGSSSSTDFIAYASNGNDNTGWIDMGITSQNFSDPSFTITGPNDGYIFMSAPENTTGKGNLVIATDETGTENKIIFAAGGLGSNNEQMSITPDVNVHIEIPTASTSPTTGALTVVGGVGIQGDVNIQGDITFGGTGTTLTTTTLTVTDPQVRVGDGNVTDAVDLGVVGEYGVGGSVRYTGVVRDASDGKIKFFTGLQAEPTNGVVNFSGTGLAYADLKAGSIELDSATIGSVSNTELQYLNNVTSNIQTQIDAKQDASSATATFAPKASPTFTGTVVLPSDTSIGNVSATEIGYLDTVSSNIQTQLDAKLSTSTASSTYAALSGASLLNPILTGAKETATISSTALTGTVAIDAKTKSVYYFTSDAAADWTFNFRGDGSTTMNSFLNVGESVTVAVLATIGSTARRAVGFQIDGSTVTPKWQGGTAPTSGNASSIDSYTFTILKTGASTYTVFASQVKFA